MKFCEVRVKTSPSRVGCLKLLALHFGLMGIRGVTSHYQLCGSAVLCSQCAVSDRFAHQNHRFLKAHRVLAD